MRTQQSLADWEKGVIPLALQSAAKKVQKYIGHRAIVAR